MKLRPYQLEAVPAMRKFRAKVGRKVLYVLATGGGKTVIIDDLFKAAIAKGSRCLFITPRISLVRQTVKVFEAGGLDVSIIWAGAPKSFVPHKQLQVACMQTLARRLKLPEFVAALGEFELSVVDECFPAGTLVATPKGDVPIELVDVDDCIYNADGIGVVKATKRSKSPTLYRLRYSDGAVIECTGSHPIFTRDGFVKANELEVGSIAYSREDLRRMQEAVFSERSHGELSSKGYRSATSLGETPSMLIRLQRISAEKIWGGKSKRLFASKAAEKMAGWCNKALSIMRRGDDSLLQENRRVDGLLSVDEATRLLSFLRKESQESDGPRERSQKGKGIISKNKTSTNQKGWEWQAVVASTVSAIACAWGWMERRIYISNAKWQQGLPKPLQAGFSQSVDNAGDRDRRKLAPEPREAGSRREKDGISCGARLVGKEIVECGRDVDVFNLHVSGSPTYFANGKLVHNCHIICSEEYKDILLSLAGEKNTLIGLTATPWAKGLDAIYDGIVSTISPAELLSQGYLTPCRAVTGEISLDLGNIKVERGEYKESDVRQAVEKDTVYADILKTYKEFAEGKRGVFFCAGKGHADALSKQFIEAGVSSAVVVAETPAEEREQIFDQCRAGEVLCLFSVDALSEGLDIPQIEVVGLCKPTKSLNKYIQRVGRGARTSPDTGKEFFWLLDFVGAIAEHGLPFDERPYYMPAKAKPKKAVDDEGEDEKEKTTWNCGSCRGINSKSSMTCNVCGARKPLPPPKVVLSIGVTMKEVTQGGKEVLANINTKDRQAIFSALIGFLETMGENPNCAYHTWNDHFGSYPVGLKKTKGKWVETAQGLRDTFIKKRIEWKRKQSRGSRVA